MQLNIAVFEFLMFVSQYFTQFEVIVVGGKTKMVVALFVST